MDYHLYVNQMVGLVRLNNWVDGNGYRIAATAPSAYFEGDTCSLASGLLVADIGSWRLRCSCRCFLGRRISRQQFRRRKIRRSIPNGTVAKAQYKAYVYDDPSTIFKMQADQAGSLH
jgi:hypothetical protein